MRNSPFWPGASATAWRNRVSPGWSARGSASNATTIAAATLLREGQACLTAEYKLNLLAPATGSVLTCRARVVKPGRSVSVVAADVFSVADGKETQTATALASISILDAARLDPQLLTGGDEDI
jgi:hypothetical protein